MSIVPQGLLDQSIQQNEVNPVENSSETKNAPDQTSENHFITPSNPDATIVISNIDPIITLTDLTDVLRDCGAINQSNITTHPRTNERICLIEFSESKAVESALIVGSLNVALGEKVLVIERYTNAIKSWNLPVVVSPNPSHQSLPLAPQAPNVSSINQSINQSNALSSPSTALTSFALPQTSATIYVGHLSPIVNEDILHQYFNQVGPVAAVRIQSDATVTSRYAFVEFLHPASAERAMSLNGAVLLDRNMKIGPASNSSATAAKPGVLAQLTSATPDAIVEKVAELSQVTGADPSKLTSALAKVAEAQRLVAMKMGVTVHQQLPDPVQILTVANKLNPSSALPAAVDTPASNGTSTIDETNSRRHSRRSRSRSSDADRHRSSRSSRSRRSRSPSDRHSSRHRSRHHNRSSSPRRRHSDRDRSHRRRSRSRSSDRRRSSHHHHHHHHHSSDDDRQDRGNHHNRYRRREPKPDLGPNVEMIFDGFNWTAIPIVSAASTTTEAVSQ